MTVSLGEIKTFQLHRRNLGGKKFLNYTNIWRFPEGRITWDHSWGGWEDCKKHEVLKKGTARGGDATRQTIQQNKGTAGTSPWSIRGAHSTEVTMLRAASGEICSSDPHKLSNHWGICCSWLLGDLSPYYSENEIPTCRFLMASDYFWDTLGT